VNQHLEKLDHCHARLKPAILKVLAAMEALGFPMMISDGIRSTDQQSALYAKGRTLPGPIVTYCDGVTKKSHHQSGRACDCCFVIDGQPSFDARLPWKAFGACAEALGLTWGGNFSRLNDLGHVELPE
jgi:peptidoglycan L-alanyl-D-glutamate endopeptidase CwlK